MGTLENGGPPKMERAVVICCSNKYAHATPGTECLNFRRVNQPDKPRNSQGYGPLLMANPGNWFKGGTQIALNTLKCLPSDCVLPMTTHAPPNKRKPPKQRLQVKRCRPAQRDLRLKAAEGASRTCPPRRNNRDSYKCVYIYIYIYIYAPPPPHGPWFYCLLGMANLEFPNLYSRNFQLWVPKA